MKTLLLILLPFASILGIILLILYWGKINKLYSGRKVSIGSPWKIFGKIVSLSAIAGICYGGYLLACYCWPTPERLAFKELSKNLAENELRPEKKILRTLKEKVNKGELLTEEEKRQVMLAEEKIRNVRKDYSDGKLVPPPPKLVSAKPKEEVWDWTFKWERNGKQWEEAKRAGRKKKGEKYPAKVREITPNYIKMEYISGYSGKAEEVLLKVGDTGDFWATDYFIKSNNPKEIDLSLKVSLHKDPESPGNFTGIFWQDQDGQQVDCWLSKK